jgi:transposase
MPRASCCKLTRKQHEREEVRKKVLKLHAEGMGYGKIGKALKIGKSTVQDIIRVFKPRGSVVAKKTGHRPSHLSKRSGNLLF